METTEETSTADGETAMPTTTGQVTVDSESATASAICGDGHVDPGEQCDEGDLSPNDVCQSDCTLTPHCGNGKLEAGEECDDGNLSGGDGCTLACKSAICGDGLVQVSVEECDDGNQLDDDRCLSNCIFATCGDGFVNINVEGCDDGNLVETDACLSACVPAACGDGILHFGAEECDDGNHANEDGCTNFCAPAKCGDGFVYDGVEQCDDGNNFEGDACSKDCVERRVIFVTSEVFAADFDGLEGADMVCDFIAQREFAQISGVRWLAWLSDEWVSPNIRMDIDYQGEYVRPDGVLVAVGWEGLTSGALQSPINVAEDKSVLPGFSLVWTNTNIDGFAENNSCLGWVSKNPQNLAEVGEAAKKNQSWTTSGVVPCNNWHHLYCVQDIW